MSTTFPLDLPSSRIYMLECPFILPGKISQVLPNVDPLSWPVIPLCNMTSLLQGTSSFEMDMGGPKKEA